MLVPFGELSLTPLLDLLILESVNAFCNLCCSCVSVMDLKVQFLDFKAQKLLLGVLRLFLVQHRLFGRSLRPKLVNLV